MNLDTPVTGMPRQTFLKILEVLQNTETHRSILNLLPEFTSFLGHFRDRDTRVVLPDLVAILIEPQKVGRLRSLGGVRVLALLRLPLLAGTFRLRTIKRSFNRSCITHYLMHPNFLPSPKNKRWEKRRSGGDF